MTALQLSAASAVLVVGALLQGSIGFGLALFSAPLLAAIDPAFAPGPLLVASLCLTGLMAQREMHAVRRADLGWALGGRAIGIVIAIAVIQRLSAHGLELYFAGLVLTAVGITAAGVAFDLSPRTLLGAGIVSGIMGTTTAIGGPPMAIVYQRERGPLVRGTLSAYFAIGAVFSILGLAAVGRFGIRDLTLGLALCPGVVIGFLLSRRFLPLMDRQGLRPAILVLSASAALFLIARRLF